jgi:hypothetical protein
MHESVLRPGESVTVRKGAPLPGGHSLRRLTTDVRGKVVSVTGRSVNVEADEGFRDEAGLLLSARFLPFDQSYVFRRD